MTLAAAYQVGNVPVLLSDVLMTGGSGTHHHPVVTRVNLEVPLPIEWQIPVSGLTRKLIKISDNLAVAVAGNGFGASVICQKLRLELQSKTPNFADLVKILSAMADALSDATCCTLVGWIMEGADARSFKWDSRTPDQMTSDDDFVIGTGEALFREVAWNTHQKEMPIRDFDHAQHYALTQISSLLLNEITNGAPIQNLFGGGYDLLIWDGMRFRHGANVTFLFLNENWLQSQNKSLRDAAPIIIRQSEIEDCLIIRALLGNQLQTEPDRHERAAVIAPLTSLGKRHALSREYDWMETPHFADRIFVIISGTNRLGAQEHWSGGVTGEQAALFSLEQGFRV